ncbi:MAG: FlgD immunoglobulin-like domain containing protein [Candidatus Eisenbacteria bacterium]
MALVAATCVAPRTVSAFPSYSEDFTTTTYEDTDTTTADWNTTDGELRLYPGVHLLADVDTPDLANDLAIAGDYAFVADDHSGLQVVDISDGRNPMVIGSLDTPDQAEGVFVDGDWVFVADLATGLLVIDASDPTAPFTLGSVNTPGSAYSVFASGDLAYVADGPSGLQVVSIYNPTAPVIIGTVDTPGSARKVFVDGFHAFIADDSRGLQIVDVSDPTNPIILGSVDTPGQAQGIVVDGDLAYLADGGSGLQIIDVSDPTNPFILGSLDTPGLAEGVSITGDRLCVADRANGFVLVNVADPTNPTILATLPTPGFARDVAVSGEFAYVAQNDAGLQVVRVNLLTTPSLAGSQETRSTAVDVAVAGDYAFSLDNLYGLRVMDISDPTNPTLVGTYETNGGAQLTVQGDYVFVASLGTGLRIIDISDPTNPLSVGAIDTGYGDDVAVAGDHAFLATGLSGGLDIVDISDVTSPTLVGSIATPGSARGVAVAGDYAFIADYSSGIQVIDIGDFANLTLVASVNTPGRATAVAVAGNYAFVSDYNAGLRVIDITDPTHPALAGSLALPGATADDVEVAGDLAFVSGNPGGLFIIDIHDPTNPTLAQTYAPGSVLGAAVAGDYAFLARFSAGFEVVRIYQDELDPTAIIGQSIDLDGATDTILGGRLTTTSVGAVSWELSADGGANWTAVTPGAGSTRITEVGDDLRWRATFAWSPGDTHPVVSDLTIDWLNEFGSITTITDVPGDQGGWVRVAFDRSGYDFADEESLPITGYGTYRRMEDAAAAEEARRSLGSGTAGNGPVVTNVPSADLPVGSLVVGGAGGGAASEGPVPGDPASAVGTFPPGVWELVSFHPATQQDSYVSLAPTVTDSTAADGPHWSVYLVTTHTTTPSIWFASQPDSGYSVDNIAPGVPQNLVFESPAALQWDPAPEDDFQYYSVYGSDSGDFGTATFLGYTVDPIYDVSATPFAVYHVTTSDHAGNESGDANVGNTSSAPQTDLPRSFALDAAYPNPLRSSSTITFDMPESAPVTLRIVDVAGRQVRVLVEGQLTAGRHAASWDGRNERGVPLAPGVYFARLEAGSFRAGQRLVVVR